MSDSCGAERGCPIFRFLFSYQPSETSATPRGKKRARDRVEQGSQRSNRFPTQTVCPASKLLAERASPRLSRSLRISQQPVPIDTSTIGVTIGVRKSRAICDRTRASGTSLCRDLAASDPTLAKEGRGPERLADPVRRRPSHRSSHRCRSGKRFRYVG